MPHSRAHKTSSSHGPATLVLEGTDAFLFKQLLSKMRPTIQSDSDSAGDRQRLALGTLPRLSGQLVPSI